MSSDTSVSAAAASLTSLEFKPLPPRTINKTRKVSAQAKARNHRFAVVLDPQDIQAMDPFLMMAEDWMKAPSGYPNHPHRGFETVTVVLEGQVKHSDSTGRSGVLGVGDIQWMTAGRGVIHSEMPHGDEEAHLLQLWLNLPRAHKMTNPTYKDLLYSKMPVAELAAGVNARVISGVHRGVSGIAANFVPVLGLWITAEGKEEFTVDIPSHFNGFLYVIKGEGQFGPNKLSVKSPTVLILPPVGEWTEPTQQPPTATAQSLAVSLDSETKSTAPNSAESSVQAEVETASNVSDTDQSRASSQASLNSRTGGKGRARKSEDAWDHRWPLSSLSVRGVRGLEFVLFAGQPLHEPIAHQGPFVMNTEQELQQAFRDFQAGKFK